MKKSIFLIVVALSVSTSNLTQANDVTYHIFDKILTSVYSCHEPPLYPHKNVGCRGSRLVVTGWIRESSGSTLININENTTYIVVQARMPYVRNPLPLQAENDLRKCTKAIDLVKSNPSKWDLRLGIYRTELLYCEAVNQSLVQQYYAEQE